MTTIQLSNNIYLVKGNILNTSMQTIVIPISLLTALNSGLALRVKKQHPQIYQVYKQAIENKLIDIGKPYKYQRLLLFPTKKHWLEISKPENIQKGLQWIAKNYKQENIQSIAIPATGHGLGEISPEITVPLIVKELEPTGMTVEIYLPL